MNTTQAIQHHIQKIPRGEPFVTSSLIEFGTRAAIDQTLSRLANAGEIVRLTRGVYVRPEENRLVGKVLPEPFKIAKAIANKTNEQIQVSGAEAARRLGLSTQVPAKPIFLTTGQSRCFKLGKLEVTLKHVSSKKIPISDSAAGLAIVALWYLGKNLTTDESIKKIEEKLSSQEFEIFLSSIKFMPIWLANIVLRYKKLRQIKHA